MPTRKPQPKKRSVTSKGANKASVTKEASTDLLEPADLRRMILETANVLAPDDISNLIANEADIRRRVGELKHGPLDLLRAQLALALDLLRDHLEGACSQIPYRTISIVGAAVLYFTDELDLIPDFLPDVGRLDDAAVMAIAFELAHAGIERYCDATDRVLPQRPQG